MSEPEAAEAGRSGDGPVAERTPRKTRPSPRNRRLILEDSGLPRLERGHRHVDGEAKAWRDYLGPLADRLGLPRPVPKWSIADLRRAGHAHLTAETLQRRLGTEPHPTEQRRLRSEIRRSVSQARTAERVLAKMVAEQKAAEQAAVPNFKSLLSQVGRR